MNSPSAAPLPAAGPPGRLARAGRSTTRILQLLLVCVAVLGLGLDAGTGGETARARTFSEEARRLAQAEARELAARAEQLGAPFAADAGVLAEQAALLADPEFRPVAPARGTLPAAGELSERDEAIVGAGPGSPGPSRAAAAETAAGGAEPAADTSPAGAGSATEYASDLAEGARQNLANAARADGGTARLLAAVGASQRLLAARAADTAGIPLPAEPEQWAPTAATAPACSGMSGADSADNTVGAGTEQDEAAGPGPAAALTAAVEAEFGAAYAYEVAQARLAGTFGDFSPALADRLSKAAESHAHHGSEAVDLLPLVCRPALAPPPSYTLSAGFTADPLQALDELEASLPGVYADLVSRSEGPVRSWAVDRLVEASAPAVEITGAVPPAVGLPNVPEPHLRPSPAEG